MTTQPSRAALETPGTDCSYPSCERVSSGVSRERITPGGCGGGCVSFPSMAEPQSSGYGLVGEKKIGNAGDTDVSVSILASSPTRARASSNALAAVDDST